jgi:hypothetical protein
MTTAPEDYSTGDRAIPCRWCATANSSWVTFCPNCGHNVADVRGCTCPTCTARVSHPTVAALQAPFARVLVLRRDADRVWRGDAGSAVLFGDRGQVCAKSPADLWGLAVMCASARISLLLDHGDQESGVRDQGSGIRSQES